MNHCEVDHTDGTRHYMISIEKVNTVNEKHNMVSIVKVNTMNTEAGVYRVRHRRRNVQGQIITQEKECSGSDNFSGMNVQGQGPTISQEKECMVTIITLEKECIGTDHCTGNQHPTLQSNGHGGQGMGRE